MSRKISIYDEISVTDMENINGDLTYPCRCGGEYLIPEDELDQVDVIECSCCSMAVELIKSQ